uniref:Cytochrome P450 n=1 Tax=Kalanchoe fedtschenkoi TaxID=63787 RepID=A0A7N0VF83_KALFE
MESILLFQGAQLLSISIILLIAYIYRHNTKSKNITATNSPDAGFPHYPMIGTLPSFLKHRHRFLDWSTDILRRCPTHTSCFFRPGKIHGVMTAYPPNVEHMLKTNFENYPKGPRFIFLLRDFLGDGIFNVDADLWKLQRKTASYEFNTKSLRNFVMETVGFEVGARLVPLLKQAAQLDRVLDLQDVLERFAFDSICRLAFNFDPECLGDDESVGKEFMRAFEDAATLSSRRFMTAFPFVLLVKKRLGIGSERRLKAAIGTVHEFVNQIIEARLRRAKTEEIGGDADLLSRFMEVHGGSVKFLRDVAISFILAGRDTSSSALTWFFWLISSRPEVVEKIRAELEHIRSRRGNNGGQAGEIYSFDELREMHYLHAAITESMRLYPPVAVDTKACLSDDVLPDGTFVGAGWFVSYSAYAMGRMESMWGKDCEEFVPERWLDEEGVFKGESPYKFAVFHGGPRVCLGKEMAYIQMKSVAAKVLEEFEVEVVGKERQPEYVLSLTLRMKGGLSVRVRQG